MTDLTKYNGGGGLRKASITDLLQDLDKKKELAGIFIKSKLIPSAYDTPEKVLVAMMKAQELDIPALEALASMAVINGRVTMQGNLILALINRSGKAKKIVFDSKDTYCTVTMSRRDYELCHTETFTLDDARTAGLLGKDIWKKYQKTMLKWRAVANCARVVFPEILSGLYTPEEIASIDDSVIISIDDDENVHVAEQPQAKDSRPLHHESEGTKPIEIDTYKMEFIKAALSIDELLAIYNSIPNGEKDAYTSELSIRKKFLQSQYKQADEILQTIRKIDNGIDYIACEQSMLDSIEALSVTEEKKKELLDALDLERQKYELQ